MVFRRKNGTAINVKTTLLKYLKWQYTLSVILLAALTVLIIHLSTILNQKTIYPGISVDGIPVALNQEYALYFCGTAPTSPFKRTDPADHPLKQYRLPLHDIHYERNTESSVIWLI